MIEHCFALICVRELFTSVSLGIRWGIAFRPLVWKEEHVVTGSPSMKVSGNKLTLGKLPPDGPTVDQRMFFGFALFSILVFSLLHVDFTDDGVCLRGSQMHFN